MMWNTLQYSQKMGVSLSADPYPWGKAICVCTGRIPNFLVARSVNALLGPTIMSLSSATATNLTLPISWSKPGEIPFFEFVISISSWLDLNYPDGTATEMLPFLPSLQWPGDNSRAEVEEGPGDLQGGEGPCILYSDSTYQYFVKFNAHDYYELPFYCLRFISVLLYYKCKHLFNLCFSWLSRSPVPANYLFCPKTTID